MRTYALSLTVIVNEIIIVERFLEITSYESVCVCVCVCVTRKCIAEH